MLTRGSTVGLALQKTTQKYFFPYEFIEANWRLWTFIILIAAGSVALVLYPVGITHALIDPFYSPTVLIVPIPGLFRLTCYAYRKDYHRHLFHHPLGCDNPERDERHSQPYTGERNAIFQFENLHRYFLYAGISLLPFFYYDFYYSLVHYSTGITLTLGSIVILANALALTAWTLSCHAFRHLIGGNIDCYSCVPGGKGRKKIYDVQTWWNSHHEAFAWISLLTIIFADLYIRAVAVGIPIDPVLIHVQRNLIQKLEKRKTYFPQVLRYPFFLIGLLVLIGGGIGVIKANLPSAMTVDAEAAVAIVGFVFLILAVAIP